MYGFGVLRGGLASAAQFKPFRVHRFWFRVRERIKFSCVLKLWKPRANSLDKLTCKRFSGLLDALRYVSIRMSLKNSHKAGLLGTMDLIFSNPGLRVPRRDIRPQMKQKVAKCGVAFSFLSGNCIF